MSVVLVTGANGFVGRYLCDSLTHKGHKVRAAIRSVSFDNELDHDEQFVIGNIGSETRWEAALHDVDYVVHLAARVHIMNDDARDPLAEFRRINVEGTLNLARQAVAANVKRFIFISSIKVNGEETELSQRYTADDVAAPLDYYGITKFEAEESLRKLASDTNMEVVIIRPPLVYGPGVKANFFSMMNWLYKGIPLPFSSVHNKRSFVALDNLVDLIVTCIDHLAAANQTFLVSDNEDLSTTELLQRMSEALGKPARLFLSPTWLLMTVASFFGKRNVALRLLGSLQVDITKTMDVLNWTPPVSVDDALKKTADYYLAWKQGEKY